MPKATYALERGGGDALEISVASPHHLIVQEHQENN